MEVVLATGVRAGRKWCCQMDLQSGKTIDNKFLIVLKIDLTL